jgi:hypothetical protein
VDEPTDQPVPLTGKAKRLKSLNEFEPPYWKGLFQPGKHHHRETILAVLVGLIFGLVLGFYFFV